ncbi:MAG: hypothetical protein KF784_02545 [Fimbriimonadaceae bacterium]|nr:hypothetical protein [Fimbriimonadaceae bacterium]
MTLSVTFDKFAETLTRFGMSKDVFIVEIGGKVMVTAVNPEKRFFVSAESPNDKGLTEADLKQSGLVVFEGRWQEGAPGEQSHDSEVQFVAAVAYKAKNNQIGLWMDAFPFQPTQAQVLHAVYDEFKQHGDLGELGFEAFVRLANPTVVIASNPELASFARKHLSPP